MVIEPQTSLFLLSNTRLKGYKNQLDFENRTTQSNYFMGKRSRQFEEFRYIRRDSVLAIPENIETLYSCDYVMYKNANFGGRWIYAFINRKEYVNDSTTNLYIETDVFQTWQFDIQYFKSFINQCHEPQWNNGEPTFNNLFPESMEYGRDYVVKHTEVVSWNKFYALISSSADLTANYGDEETPILRASKGGTFDKLPSVLDYYVVDIEAIRTDPLNTILEEFSSAPWVTQCIQSITVVPTEAIGNNFPIVETHGGHRIGKLQDGYESANFSLRSIEDWWQKFGSFTNTKLYTYPYSFIEMTCYNGTQFIIKPEALNDTEKIEFALMNYIGANPRISYFVKNYNDSGDNGYDYDGRDNGYGEFLEAGITLGNFPQLPVAIDNYLLYQANNANSFSLSNSINNYNKKEAVAFAGIEGTMGMASSALSGNIGGVLSSAYSASKSAYMGVKNSEIAIRQQLAKIQDAELIPPTISGQTGGDAFNIANGVVGFTLKWKTIRPEFAKKLDDYFTRYGYTQNKMAVPSLTGNMNFNYIKTTGIQLGGNIPLEDIQVLEAMFDNGTTIWHNGIIGNYTNNPSNG